MSALELALTVFVWGCVPGGAFLALCLGVYLNALAERAKAQTRTEVTMHRT